MSVGVFEGPHRRYDPLTDGWVLVSPDRTARPWQGATEGDRPERRPAHDPGCSLCPGNARAGGHRNRDYDGTFVFDNDFPSLRPDTTDETWSPAPLLHAEGQPGVCRVLCFHPRHDLTLARMGTDQVRPVVDVWVEQVRSCRSATPGCSCSRTAASRWARRTRIHTGRCGR